MLLFSPIQINIDSDMVYYDIPLSNYYQEYTQEQCIEYNVPYELVLAIMKTESEFDLDIVSKTDDYGIMQINIYNHEWFKDMFGFSDILIPENNIKSGVFLIGYLYNKYDTINEALMGYNYGEGRASYYWNKGIYTSKYSEKVMKAYETYR